MVSTRSLTLNYSCKARAHDISRQSKEPQTLFVESRGSLVHTLCNAGRSKVHIDSIATCCFALFRGRLFYLHGLFQCHTAGCAVLQCHTAGFAVLQEPRTCVVELVIVSVPGTHSMFKSHRCKYRIACFFVGLERCTEKKTTIVSVATAFGF